MTETQQRGKVHEGEQTPVPEAPSKPAWGRYLAQLVVLVVLAGGAVLGYRYWTFATAHVSTEDAALSNDVIQISPQVSGTILQVLVHDNQMVKKGDLLVRLDDATYRAAVDQARANLNATIAQAQGAGVSVNLADESGDAQMMQAQGLLAQASSSIAGAHADVSKAEMGVVQAQATARGAESTVSTMQAALDAATANKQRAVEAQAAAQAQVDNAQAAVRAQQAVVVAAQANADKAARDEERYKSLFKQDAISEQAVDQATAAATSARAQVDAAKQQVASAEAQVAVRQADVKSAQQQVNAAEAAIAQASAQLAASRDQLAAVRAGVGQAKAQSTSVQQNVHLAEARYTQALGQVHQAHTKPKQVAMNQSNQAQARAKIDQARAALASAMLLCNYTQIYAPADGQISKKSAQVGALVQTGTPLMAIVPQSDVWVVANYKETQLTDVHPGQHADIDVDALPGKHFTGKVESINAATGATFALLPPDNATGNFTKVVQRIPVKIVLDRGQPEMERLRAGMSVTAIIAIRETADRR